LLVAAAVGVAWMAKAQILLAVLAVVAVAAQLSSLLHQGLVQLKQLR
tara:strand:- start:289 stop:429 length:141 start_codon:yes stop_codon:yes gene_type:complete